MRIQDILQKLDRRDDSQWTNDGAPRLDVVSELAGRSVTRKEIIEAAPLFSRFASLDAEGSHEPEPKQVGDPGEADLREDEAGMPQLDEPEPEPEPEPVAVEAAPESDEPEHMKNQRAIQAWLAQQHQNRVDRAKRRAAILANVDPRDLQARSPLDQALARKTARGAQRPTFTRGG